MVFSAPTPRLEIREDGRWFATYVENVLRHTRHWTQRILMTPVLSATRRHVERWHASTVDQVASDVLACRDHDIVLLEDREARAEQTRGDEATDQEGGEAVGECAVAALDTVLQELEKLQSGVVQHMLHVDRDVARLVPGEFLEDADVALVGALRAVGREGSLDDRTACELDCNFLFEKE